METCPHCTYEFEVELVTGTEDYTEYNFRCPSCDRRFTVENLPRLVWRLDTYSKRYYSTLIHRYKKIEAPEFVKWDYHDKN